jgi:predicted DNA-binding transcriptional regulator YafY
MSPKTGRLKSRRHLLWRKLHFPAAVEEMLIPPQKMPMQSIHIMRADRLLSIVMLLQARGKMTARDLADELEVSRRTVLRDLDALSTSGVPLYAEGGHGGGITLDEGYRTSLTGLREREVRALFVAGDRSLLRDIGLGDAADAMQRKLSAALPKVHREAVDRLRQRIYIDPRWWWHDDTEQPFWRELQEAVQQDRRIRITYENYQGELAERELAPYSLVAKSGYWYLVARHADALKTYRVSRIHALTVLSEAFVRDPAFDLTEYWHTDMAEFVADFSEYVFTLRVHPARERFLRWLRPGRNRLLETHADGWLTFEVQAESAELAAMLVFGLGRQCEVLSPASLREATLAACREVATHLSAQTP